MDQSNTKTGEAYIEKYHGLLDIISQDTLISPVSGEKVTGVGNHKDKPAPTFFMSALTELYYNPGERVETSHKMFPLQRFLLCPAVFGSHPGKEIYKAAVGIK